MLRSQRRGRDPPCWLSEKEPLVGKRRVNFQRCWLPVSRIGLHRRGVERVNCGPKLLDLGEKGVYSSYTSPGSPWRNGYVESFNSRIRDECLNINSFYSLLHAQVIIGDWKDEYNHHRRHSSLGYLTPAEYARQCTHQMETDDSQNVRTE